MSIVARGETADCRMRGGCQMGRRLRQMARRHRQIAQRFPAKVAGEVRLDFAAKIAALCLRRLVPRATRRPISFSRKPRQPGRGDGVDDGLTAGQVTQIAVGSDVVEEIVNHWAGPSSS
ncbi:MAG: hypothetical protein ACR2HJ_01385 [Fimbriimonadales bacterium]